MKETLGRIQFFKMISKLSMSNRNLLASRLSFIIFGFCSKQINSMLRRISGLFFNKLDSQEDAKSLFFTYSSISIIAALLTSVVYGIRFYYSSLVYKYVAPLLFSDYIRTDYNEFHIFGPSKNLQRMNRNSWSLRDAMEIAAYEITLNFVSIMVATRDLFQILEIEVFLPMIIVILVIFLFQMVFYVIVNRLKAEIIQIDELKITEMADVFNNIKLVKTSHQNEENLMKNYFKNTLYLRYRFLCLSSEFITALALIIPNIYALYSSKSLKVNVSRYVKSIASLNSSMLLLKSCFFKLEARRLELQDLIQSKSNVRIQNTEFKSSIEFLNLSVNFKSCRFHDLNFKI